MLIQTEVFLVGWTRSSAHFLSSAINSSSLINLLGVFVAAPANAVWIARLRIFSNLNNTNKNYSKLKKSLNCGFETLNDMYLLISCLISISVLSCIRIILLVPSGSQTPICYALHSFVLHLLQLLKYGTLSLRLFECVPAMILSAINSKPTTSSRPSNPLSASSLAPQIRLWLIIVHVYKLYLLTYLFHKQYLISLWFTYIKWLWRFIFMFYLCMSCINVWLHLLQNELYINGFIYLLAYLW